MYVTRLKPSFSGWRRLLVLLAMDWLWDRAPMGTRVWLY